MTLEEAEDNIGGGVVYHALHQDSLNTPGEKGVIMSVRHGVVFVRFGLFPKACLPEQLTLA